MKAEHGWAVAALFDDGSWELFSVTFEYSRAEAIDAYMAQFSGMPEDECPKCFWHEQQRIGQVRCVRVVLKEEGQ